MWQRHSLNAHRNEVLPEAKPPLRVHALHFAARVVLRHRNDSEVERHACGGRAVHQVIMQALVAIELEELAVGHLQRRELARAGLRLELHPFRRRDVGQRHDEVYLARRVPVHRVVVQPHDFRPVFAGFFFQKEIFKSKKDSKGFGRN